MGRNEEEEEEEEEDMARIGTRERALSARVERSKLVAIGSLVRTCVRGHKST